MSMKKAVAALSLAALIYAPAAVAAKQPNVLLIVADDLGFSDTEPFGGEISTPNINRLAREGAILNRFYTGPTCSVTRSMLLTGNDNHQAGLGSMAEFLQPEQKGKPGYEGRLNSRVITLAEILKNHGYASFVTGKWHLGATDDSHPKARGFDRSFTLMPGGAAHMDASQMFPGNYKARYFEDGKETTLPPEFKFSSDFFTDKLLSYLKNDRKKGQPFFGYLAFTAPHWPLQAPDEYLHKYRNHYREGYDAVRKQRLARMIEKGIVPAGTEANNPLEGVFYSWRELNSKQRAEETKAMQIYAAMVDNLDHNVGRVIQYLNTAGELDNTLILFISDNGSESATPESLGTTEDKNGIREWVDTTFDNSLANMGKKGSYVTLGPQWAQVSSTPLPYFKSILSDGGIHVPAVIRYPSKIKAGRIQSETLHVIDFVPTVLELTGAKRPKSYRGNKLLDMEGRSFLSVFNGKKMPERSLGWEFNNRKALYRGNWAAVRQNPPYGTGKWELYNRKTDPSFLTNLAARHPQKTRFLAAEWDKYARRVGVVEAPVRYKYGQMNCFYDQCIQPDFLKKPDTQPVAGK
ncbi:MAG: arylsulfatase [Neisseria zoodegmatis]|uniref:arylsulfatase n=1 Tax=Neisseria zoodegmatis TaxID=326523 RepID=UPI0026ED7C8D|nr:arylsulfatase [Neisseria zoodegmatis]MDO5070343.1 arylsulfatase [Neisseria zoodegmatis]